jgi:hypothetical protein
MNKVMQRKSVWVLIVLGCALAYMFISGSFAFYGSTFWAGVPWDWSYNVQVGLSNGHWFAAVNEI